MESQTKTRTTVLELIKNTMKAVFESKEEFINNIDDITDWEQCINEKDTDKFSDDDRKEIERIMKLEESLEKRKMQTNSIKENLKAQIKDSKKRPNMKLKVREEEIQK